MMVMQYQRGRRGDVIIVNLLCSTYEGEGKVEEKEREGTPDDEWRNTCG
jgi:hypothetical protein